MMNCLFRCAVLSAALLTTSLASAVELMEWDRTPLKIALPVGKERLVVLDRNVSVGLPETVANAETLRVQSTGGVLYLKAHTSFDTQRVQLRDETSGEIILVDLTASDDAPDEQIKVVNKDVLDESIETPAGESAAVAGPPMPVLLTRFAAQSLYAPVRLIEPVAGLNRTAMRLPGHLTYLLPTLPVEAQPIAAWSLEGWHVTAIRLRNLDPARSFELDPRHLQGDLSAATFMHSTLGPSGTLQDTTTVLVVTQGALAEQLPQPRRQTSGDAVPVSGGGA